MVRPLIPARPLEPMIIFEYMETFGAIYRKKTRVGDHSSRQGGLDKDQELGPPEELGLSRKGRDSRRV